MKLTIGDAVMEGTIEELREWAELSGVEFPTGKAEAEPKYRKISKDKAQVGDFVKYAESDAYVESSVYYKIAGFDEYGDIQILDRDGDEYDTGGDYFEVYTLRETEEEPAVEPLKVGDYAKLKTTGYYGLRGLGIGQIVKLAFNDVGKSDFKVLALDGYSHGYTNASNLEKVSAEEVAKIEAEEKKESERLEELRRWAKIGRKPSEFKKGDIVEVTGERFGNKYYGEIEGLTPRTVGERYYFRTFGHDSKSSEKVSTIKLITPVEARFDLNGDGRA